MGGFLKVVEDRPTPPAVYNWRIYSCSLLASFAAIAIGYDSSFIGTTISLESFVRDFNFNQYSSSGLAKLKEDIVSVYQAGAFFGALAAYVCSYLLGRNKSLLIFLLVASLGAALNCGAKGAGDLGLIIGGRVLTGWGIGGCSSLVPIYLSELSPPGIRGRLVGFWELAWQLGTVAGFWISYGVNQTLAPTRKQWVIPFAIQLIPVGLLFFGVFYLPESPRWLLANGQRDKAIKKLTWLRKLEADDIYIVEEIAFIDAEIERHKSEVGVGFWKPFAALKQRRIQWRFLIGGLLFMFQNGSGINAMNYYSPTVFQSIGIHGQSTYLLTTGVWGIVKSTECLVWLFFCIDRFGRRNLLLWGSLGCSLCMWYLGAYIKIASPDNNTAQDSPSGGGISAIFFFFLWTLPYQLSWAGNSWVINAELFDLNTRIPVVTNLQDVSALGQASAAANNWFWNFLISRFTPSMFLAMGYGVYFFFASMMLLGIVFVWFCIPETSNIPLEKIDRLFETKSVRTANAVVLEEIRAEQEEFRNRDKQSIDAEAKDGATAHLEVKV
ncbi:unnamed protein product [Clonostachys byssicola]|uniref:Quinate transporter n=1 Tax=Clonostachys byssicola TaxID=160290 RepID=A0A9N9UK41_9HYPO|nr:unnamed protein product [Clonostachys byssicola]